MTSTCKEFPAMLKVVRNQPSQQLEPNSPTYQEGIFEENVGSKKMSLQAVSFGPGLRAKPHYHEQHDSCIYVLSGELEIWFGHDLSAYKRLLPGDMLFIPAMLPHCPGNPLSTPSMSLLARNEPSRKEPRQELPTSLWDAWYQELKGVGSFLHRMQEWQVEKIPLALEPAIHKIIDPYQLQKAWTAQKVNNGSSIAGYKTAMNSKGLQQKFKCPGPLSGVLLSDGITRCYSELSLGKYIKLGMEMEIAFQVKTEITTHVDSDEEMASCILNVASALELPELGYAHFSELTFQQLVASNIGSKGFATGPSVEFTPEHHGEFLAELYHNHKSIARESSNSPVSNLRTLVNQLIEIGYPIQPGQWFLTGVIGQMLFPEVGQYNLQVSQLPSLSITIVD